MDGQDNPIQRANVLSRKFKLQLSLGQDLKRTCGIENCPEIRSAADIAERFDEMAQLDREIMVVGTVDCYCRLVHWNLISVGSSDRLVMRTGDAFYGAVRETASGIFLVHNHPSGSLQPSASDMELTRDIAEAGMLLGYPLLDHVIVSRRGYRSIMAPNILRKHDGQPPVIGTQVKRAGERANASANWRCAKCGSENALWNSIPSLREPGSGLCVMARCSACKQPAWLKNSK